MSKNEQSAESAVREIRRKTRRRFSGEEKIRIVLAEFWHRTSYEAALWK